LLYCTQLVYLNIDSWCEFVNIWVEDTHLD